MNSEMRKQKLKRIAIKLDALIALKNVSKQVEELCDQFEKVLDEFEANELTTEEVDKWNKKFEEYYAYVQSIPQKSNMPSSSQMLDNINATNSFLNVGGNYEGGDMNLTYTGSGQHSTNNKSGFTNSVFNNKNMKNKNMNLKYEETLYANPNTTHEKEKVSGNNLKYDPIEVLQNKTDNFDSLFFFECETDLSHCVKGRAKSCMSIFNKILGDFPNANNFKILKIKKEVFKQVLKFVDSKQIDELDLSSYSNDLLEAAKLLGMHEFEEKLKTKINEKTAPKAYHLVNPSVKN